MSTSEFKHFAAAPMRGDQTTKALANPVSAAPTACHRRRFGFISNGRKIRPPT